MGGDLFQLDGEHPALVHLAPALVGPSNSGLVRLGARRRSIVDREDGSVRRRDRGRGAAARAELLQEGRRAGRQHGREPRQGRRSAPARRRRRSRSGATRTCSTPGSPRRCGRSRRSAGRTRRRAQALLSDQRAGDRLRHHLLLGRPHDDDGPSFHEGDAVPHRLHPRAGARRARRQDVEVEGQRHRPARADRRIRRRRAALHAGGHGGAGPRHQALDRSASRATAISRPSCGTPPASPR